MSLRPGSWASRNALGCCRLSQRAEFWRRVTQLILTTSTKMSFFRLATRSLSRSALVSSRIPSHYIPRARYSASAGPSRETIQARILDVLKGFEKVNQAKVCHSPILLHSISNSHSLFLQLSPSASFGTDLGLDSLDAVEVMMAVEEV